METFQSLAFRCACTVMCHGVHLSQRPILMSSKAGSLVPSASDSHSMGVVSRLSTVQGEKLRPRVTCLGGDSRDSLLSTEGLQVFQTHLSSFLVRHSIANGQSLLLGLALLSPGILGDEARLWRGMSLLVFLPSCFLSPHPYH